MRQLPASYQLLHLPQVDSTNEEAKRMASTGEPHPHWIIADQQTAGRGRRGRVWQSPKGNLMTTLYLPLSHALAPLAENAGNFAFVAGLAIEATVQTLLVGTAHVVSIKWPNDILVNGAKVSGLLLETATTRNKQAEWIAIGIGINLAHHPNDTPYPATSIAALMGRAPAPIDLLADLAHHFDHFLAQWSGQGFASLLAQWRSKAHHIGKAIDVRLPHQTLHGIFENIDDNGALILQDDNGKRHHITAGDVFFPAGASV